jgi:hypothetical protein
MRNDTMAKPKKKQSLTSTTIDPAVIRSWDVDSDRMNAREEFLRRLGSPDNDQERKDCIASGPHARTKFAEWGLFYIEGEAAPSNFPIFDPNWGKTKIPSTTVFSVYENRKQRPERDQKVVLILPVTGTKPETMDQVWRCTYTPYMDKNEKGKKNNKKKDKNTRSARK